MKKGILYTIGVAAIVALGFGAGAFVAQSTAFQTWKLEREKDALPEPTTVNQPVLNQNANVDTNSNDEVANENANNNTTTDEPAPVVALPAEFNLDIPFTSQAPDGVWDAAHEEYCEEASLLMANRYLTNRGIDGPADAEAAMDAIAAYETETFGYFESTTAEETAQIATDYLDLQATVVENFTWEQAKRELVDGNVVILPAAGRELGNPFFTPPGPNYHMLVVKGWTEDKIITNDPGTRHGEDYVYDPDVLYNAVGDYNHGNPSSGATVMIVISN